MTELRQEIARAILEVSNRFIAPNFPKGFQLRGFDELDERELRLHLAYADAILALPLISKAEQRGAERMRKACEQKMHDLRCVAAGNLSPGYTGSEGMARTDSFAEAAVAIRALPPLHAEEEAV